MPRRVDERQPPTEAILVRIEQEEPGLPRADPLMQGGFDGGERAARLGRERVARRTARQILREGCAAREAQDKRAGDEATDQGHGMFERVSGRRRENQASRS